MDDFTQDRQPFLEYYREHMRELKPVPTAHHDKIKPFYYKSLDESSHVFLQCENTLSLEKPFEGPYKILSRPSDKVFEINKQGVPTRVTTDRLKPAYLEREFLEYLIQQQLQPAKQTLDQQPPQSTVQPTVQPEHVPSTSTQKPNTTTQARPRGRPRKQTVVPQHQPKIIVNNRLQPSSSKNDQGMSNSNIADHTYAKPSILKPTSNVQQTILLPKDYTPLRTYVNNKKVTFKLPYKYINFK